VMMLEMCVNIGVTVPWSLSGLAAASGVDVMAIST